MIEFEHRKYRVNNGDLRTYVEFYEYRPVSGPMPEQYKYKKLYSCWAKVDRVWLKDLEQAKANGTMSDVTLTIRDPLLYYPTDKHFLKIHTREYQDYVYNVTSSQPDLQHRDFYTVVAKLKDDVQWG